MPVIVLLLILLNDHKLFSSSKVLIFSIAKLIVYVTLYWECSRFIFLYMRNRFPQLKDTAKRIAVQSLVMCLFILLSGLVITIRKKGLPILWTYRRRQQCITE